MSIKDRLAKKTQDLVYPGKGEVITPPSPMRTGPGQMLMVNSLMKESNEKMAALETRLRQFEGGLPVLLLDPAQITASKWANRVDTSFDSPAFLLLQDEIAGSGGNVQPIKVRPRSGHPDTFEIVFGHRRHRACAALGLPVLALIEELSDADLFKQMDRENRARADLSPWEQGMMYRQALSEGLFSSREQLSRELGIDAGNLSKALRLADLDPDVIAAFSSPLDLQYRWAKPLTDALIQDRDRVQEVLTELKASQLPLPAAKVIFERLTGTALPAVRIEQVRMGEHIVAEIHVNGDRVSVRFDNGFIDDKAIVRLSHFIASGMML